MADHLFQAKKGFDHLITEIKLEIDRVILLSLFSVVLRRSPRFMF